MFAKLYDTEVGQILVKIDDGDDGAEVRFYFEPEKLGVCSIAITWGQDDKETQWKKADAAFEKITKDVATKLVKRTIAETPFIK